MQRHLFVAERVATAEAAVALETSVLAHGLPAPANLESAEAQAVAVRKSGAEPAVIGVLGGRIVVGAEEQELRRLAGHRDDGGDRRRLTPWKVAARDLPFVVARGHDGATTVSATAAIAESAGIGVMATGGIGGVHPGGLDISADLPQLMRSSILVVCSGPKHVVDARATLEWLETHGVLVVGYRVERLPGFLAPGWIPIEHTVDDVPQVAELVRAHRALGSPGALVLVQDPPSAAAMDPDELTELSAAATAAASKAGIRGKGRTPFELDWLARRTGGRSLAANLALLEANARLAGEIAIATAEPPGTGEDPASGPPAGG
ncbi:MAG TPA: pseudouridine-5'-phosphate glycosidase [Actinomycetes bacterium]|nr:pseudouridine-5'-phosphate glycosidase [Actinomycetes bacterium]